MLSFLFSQQLLRSYPEREFQGLAYVWPERQKAICWSRKTHVGVHTTACSSPHPPVLTAWSKYGSNPFLNLISQLWLCYLSKPWAIWKYLLSHQSPFGNFQANKTQNCAGPLLDKKGKRGRKETVDGSGRSGWLCCHRLLAALDFTGHFICKWSHSPALCDFHKVTDSQSRANERQGSGSEATIHWLLLWLRERGGRVLDSHSDTAPLKSPRVHSMKLLAISGGNKNDMKNHQCFLSLLTLSMEKKKKKKGFKCNHLFLDRPNWYL